MSRYIHFTKTQRRQRREQHTLRRSSIFSEFGAFAGIRARLYSKCSDTGTDTDGQQDRKNEFRKKENIIR